ncbi:MAG: bifunctional 5,10-methylene-tetrahydrofolate dehydrogenase/5,10-methylene-tetrahydrofolate cyclohydrolase, partial [Chloroflexi bacterium]|nr:bifunctional 5,10-methylene-tetrahydrofolate dehydrogenase/5,10-methylene-tetrahydrofolate cyclohydrolase [Chloroflexota bacterium]
MAMIIDGSGIAASIRQEIKQQAERLAAKGIVPGLAAVLVGDDPASAIYVRNKARACAEAGIFSDTVRLGADTTQAQLLGVVEGLNQDPRIHGILVQLPLPPQIDPKAVVHAISPAKDVDCLHPQNVGRLLIGEPHFLPCTPAGVQELLLRSGHPPEGRHVVICGRSNLVGKPLAAMLMQKAPGANATVTVCHTGTRDLAEVTRTADVLVAAMGQARFITADMVCEGVVVIDVGTNRVDDPTASRGWRLAGDVDFDAVAPKAAAITPVPGGVGPMTIAMLLRNVLR